MRNLSLLAIFCLAGCSSDYEDVKLAGVIDHPDQITLTAVDGVTGIAIKTLPRTCVYASGRTEPCPLKTMVRTEVER